MATMMYAVLKEKLLKGTLSSGNINPPVPDLLIIIDGVTIGYHQYCNGLICLIVKSGYHNDVIERCKIALDLPIAIYSFEKIGLNPDVEYLVQILLNIYQDHINQ